MKETDFVLEDGRFNQQILDSLSDEDFKTVYERPEEFLDIDAEGDDTATDTTDDDNLTPRDGGTRQGEADGGGNADVGDGSTSVPEGFEAWLTDPDTGETYENGLILGKYKTFDEAHKGFMEAQKLIGRRAVQTEKPVSEAPEYRGEKMRDISAEDMKAISDWAAERAAINLRQYFVKEGLELPTTVEDAELLKDSAPWLYALHLQHTEAAKQMGLREIQEHAWYSAHAEEVNRYNADSAFTPLVEEFLNAADCTLEEFDDVDILREQYDEIMDAILSLPENDPLRESFYETRAGVQIVSPEKVSQAVINQFRPKINAAARLSEAQRLQSKAEQSRRTRSSRATPVSLASQGSEGSTGVDTGLMPWDELSQSGAFDKLVIHFGGHSKPEAVKRAEEEYNRQMAYYEREALAQGQRMVAGQRKF